MTTVGMASQFLLFSFIHKILWSHEKAAASSPYLCVYFQTCTQPESRWYRSSERCCDAAVQDREYVPAACRWEDGGGGQTDKGKGSRAGGGKADKGVEDSRGRTTLTEQSCSQRAYQRNLPTHTPQPASQSEHSHPWPILPHTTAHPWLSKADVRWNGGKRVSAPSGLKTEMLVFIAVRESDSLTWFRYCQGSGVKRPRTSCAFWAGILA